MKLIKHYVTYYYNLGWSPFCHAVLKGVLH